MMKDAKRSPFQRQEYKEKGENQIEIKPKIYRSQKMRMLKSYLLKPLQLSTSWKEFGRALLDECTDQMSFPSWGRV
jgi:hypothetical protein